MRKNKIILYIFYFFLRNEINLIFKMLTLIEALFAFLLYKVTNKAFGNHILLGFIFYKMCRKKLLEMLFKIELAKGQFLILIPKNVQI